MIKVLFYLVRIFKDNGILVTLGIANLAVICYSFWKLFNNHLAHIQKDIKSNGKKIETMDKDVRNLGQRISKVEGKLEK